jgi:hypothetical protein
MFRPDDATHLKPTCDDARTGRNRRVPRNLSAKRIGHSAAMRASADRARGVSTKIIKLAK